MRQPIQVLVYPVRAQGDGLEYLLLRRIPSRGGFWQGVTGAPEEGEGLSDAAMRELCEETALQPMALDAINYVYTFELEEKDRHVYASDVAHVVEHVFIARIGDPSSPTLDPREHDAWKWCEFDEAFTTLTWPENREALRHAAGYLRAGVIPAAHERL